MVLLCGISNDAIIGIIGVILGWLLAEISGIIKEKIGKLEVFELRSWGAEEKRNNNGFYTGVKIHSVIQINNNKNIVACIYDWKVYICANGKKYKTDIFNANSDGNKVIDVITIQPKEVKQIMLEGVMPFETYETIYDKYDNVKNKEYCDVGKVKKIDGIEISYKCNTDSKKHFIAAKKFIIAK